MRFRRRDLLLDLVLSVGVCSEVEQGSKHEAQLRTVRGVVVDKSSELAIASAVVFLKNMRTNAVRSYIADDEGNYRFSGLDPNVDYEIQAEKDGAKVTTLTVYKFYIKKHNDKHI